MSIKLKLTILFLTAALVPAFLIGIITFINYKKYLEADRLSDLQNIVVFKADKIETYFETLRHNAELVQGAYVVRKNLPDLNRLCSTPGHPQFAEAKKTIDLRMRQMQKNLGLLDIMLVNPGGLVVYSSDASTASNRFLKPLPDPRQKAFAEGKKRVYFTEIFSDKDKDNQPEMLVTAPLFDLNEGFLGVVALEAGMAQVYGLIQDPTCLGKTGETLLVSKAGNRISFLNPPRHAAHADIDEKISFGDKTALPAQAVLQGGNGAGVSVDYRGKEVVAAWKHIPVFNWGIIAKIDSAEAFAGINNLKKTLLLVLAGALALAGLMTLYLARSIFNPIGKLIKGVETVGKGNLDYKVASNLDDEIGRLSRAFDKMIGDLKLLAAARDSERRRFYDVLETLPVYVILLTQDYHVPFANRFFRERFGESHGKRCYEYLFQRTEPCENCETFKVFKSNAPHRWKWTGPDNRNYDIYDYPFTDTDGSKLIMEMGIDITEQKRAQESLRSASLYARNLIEVSLDPLVTVSSDGKITDVNEATIKVTGRPREQLIGTDFSDYFTEPEKAREGYQQVFARGFVTDYPLTIRRKDGHLTDVLYNASVYKDTHGNVLGVFAAARDVTVLKQAEAELKRHRDNLEALVNKRTSDLEDTNKELARSNESLEQFAYVASHDLQEPLRIMANYSQLLEKRYKEKLDKDADDFIDFIVDAAKRMQKLITDLLEYSRVGSKDASMAEVDCNEVLRKVTATMAGHARVIHDNLPVLTAHETGLIRLFQNLIGNALKFRGKEPPLIHVAARRDKNEWIFSVRDNGIGIEPQYKERIFQIFQRLHSRGEYPGTGIGLAICKKIVENLDGRIWVESEPGKGSTFYFTMPIRNKP